MKPAHPVWIMLCTTLVSYHSKAEDFPFPSSEKEFQEGFGAEGGISQLDKADADKDRLKIGGELWTQLQYFGLQGQAGRKGYLFNPNTLYLYFDSRLREDTRAYVRLMSVYDPTASNGGVSPFTGQALKETQVGIEEMKLLFNIDKTVFFTIGKQKIRWGSGKFWNPTDFLNSSRRNLLYNEDRRLGVNLIKTHLPLGSANLYLVNRIEGTTDPGLVHHALRAEMPIGTAELSATGSVQRGQSPVLGMDLSSALWELDAHMEVSHVTENSADGSGRPLTHVTTGISYDYKYSDQDMLSVSLEYFRNDGGLTETSGYVRVLLAGGYQPYFLARDYGMLMLYLPTPGRWEHVSFTLFNIMNFSDRSAASKFMATLTHIQNLNVDLGLTGHYGNPDGELKLGGQWMDADVRLRVAF